MNQPVPASDSTPNQAPSAPIAPPTIAPLPPVQMPIPQAPPPPPSPVLQPQTPPPAPPVQKSGSPWPWIIGGCLLVVILIIAVVVGLGWWGIHEAKKEINNRVNEYKPTVDKLNKEGEEWEKKSQDFRESMPDPEELQKELQNTSGAAKK